MNSTGLRHAMTTANNLASQFCRVLRLKEIYGSLVKCDGSAKSPVLDIPFDGSGTVPPGMVWAGRASIATYVDQAGLVQTVGPDVLRDNDWATGNRRSLIEPYAENLEDLSDDAGDYVDGTRGTRTPDATTSPMSGKLAAHFAESDQDVSHAVWGTSNTVNFAKFDTCVLSTHVKKAESDWMQFLTQGTFGGVDTWANFNMVTGTFGNVGAGVKSTAVIPLTGGWYRIAIIFEVASAITNRAIFKANLNGDVASRNPAYLGDGVSGFYSFGDQTEKDCLTSYISTNGGTNIRAADAAPYWPQPIPQAEGTVIWQGDVITGVNGEGSFASVSSIANTIQFHKVGTDSLEMTDGTTTVGVAVTPGTDIVAVQANWGPAGMQIGVKQGSSWTHSILGPFDNTIGGNNNLSFGFGINIPMRLERGRLYDSQLTESEIEGEV